MRQQHYAIILTVGYMAFGALHPAAQGDMSGDYPNWHERSVLVLTSACRIAPRTFRDTYIGSTYAILDSPAYTSTVPVYWNYNLNRSARAHALDMAANCGLQHNSCNGTTWNTRIQSYYAHKSERIGENIAVGLRSPQGTIRQWILDGDPPPADKNGDGHRRNIMDSTFREMGTGYADGTQQGRYFWVQDFGGGAPVAGSGIVAGTHLFLTETTTTFMAVFYDPSGHAPVLVSLHINDAAATAMQRSLGSAAKGVYTLELSRASGCRTYYFSFSDATNKQGRYPLNGFLKTYGEGSCTENYSSALSPNNRRFTSDGRWLPHGIVDEKQLQQMTAAFGTDIQFTDVQGRSINLKTRLTTFMSCSEMIIATYHRTDKTRQHARLIILR